MKKLFPILLVSLFLFSCSRTKNIVSIKDYEVYLNPDYINKETARATQELDFWNKRLMADTGNYLNMKELAMQYSHLFKLRGHINDLLTADSLLNASSLKINGKDAGVLYAQSQEAIMQHRFADAYRYNQQAEKQEPNPYVNHLLNFDAAMELGKYYEASSKISNLRDKKDFNYLLREAKLQDHYGHLDKAIELMEEAASVMKEKRKSSYLWALSNLADMYGHAGRIKDSYKTYLKVLAEDSANLYCLKGIAWIAYSHDKNTTEAKRIIKFILTQTHVPDLLLLLAEIEEWEGNTEEKNNCITKFISEAKKASYGNMYNKYLILLYSEELKQYDKAIELALKEINHRPTPETYDWLAWAYFKSGEKQKAFETAMRYVYKKTFEPEAQMHTAYILDGNNRKDEAVKLFNECFESSFELGPLATMQIKEQLESMR
jgi:hypothetical protein